MADEDRNRDGAHSTKQILIVDDEELARNRLRRYLREYDASFVIEEAESGLKAVDSIQSFRPGIIFLDIEMPGLNGFEVLAQFAERPFQVVFQTAYDEFAVRAFEEHASDYLLKPYTKERFQQALDRVLNRVADEERLRALEAAFGKREGRPKKLTVRQGGKLRVIEEKNIVCFVSRDHYTCVYLEDSREAICDLSIAHLATRLDPAEFRQMHRSNIVRLKTITSLSLIRGEGMVVELTNGMKLPVSRSNRRVARDVIKEINS
ncbi:MAG: LytTR family DNA-binding domain-containing protein [Acidobacteriota bacterium]